MRAYPGDAEAVRVDPSMIHGMEGMPGHGGHGGHGAHGGTATPAPTPAPRSGVPVAGAPGVSTPRAGVPGTVTPGPTPSAHEGHAHHH